MANLAKNLKIKPSSKEAEQAILGIILKNPELIDKVASWIQTPKAFYYQNNQFIWEAMLELRDERINIDIVTVAEKCKDKHPTEQLGYHITGLIINENIVVSHINSYAKIVWEKHIQREVGKSAQRLKDASFDDYAKTDELLTEHQSLVAELQLLQPSKQKNIKLIVNETIESIKEGNDIIPIGIPALDKPASGMTRKEITVLGGRPGHGKTSLAVNIAKSLVEQDFKVMMFNREMSNIAMMKKLAIMESDGLSYGEMRRNTFTKNEVKHFLDVCENIKEKYKDKLFLYEDVRDVNGAMREIRKVSPDVIIDDYIQLVSVEKSFDHRRFAIEWLLHEYKWIVKEKNCAALLVSQLSRAIETRFDPTPRLSDFAEAGTIEQVCETAFFTFRGYQFDPETYNEYEANIISAKARYGKIGNFKVGFNGDRCSFYPSPEEAQIDTK